MKVEFYTPLPEEISIPNLRGYPQIICDKVKDTLVESGREVSIQSGEETYTIQRGADEDKNFRSTSQTHRLFLSQHEELNLFLILIKFAQEQGILEKILSTNGDNFLNFIHEKSGGISMWSSLHQGLVSMDCLNQSILRNIFPEFSHFNLGKGHHCNKETYKVSVSGDELLFSFESETLFRIHASEIIVYLQLIVSIGEGIASQCLAVLEYIFSSKR